MNFLLNSNTVLFIVSCYQIPYKFKVQFHTISSMSQLATFSGSSLAFHPILHRRERRSLGYTAEGSTKVTQCMRFKSTIFYAPISLLARHMCKKKLEVSIEHIPRENVYGIECYNYSSSADSATPRD